jgi:hypothetical protein
LVNVINARMHTSDVAASGDESIDSLLTAYRKTLLQMDTRRIERGGRPSGWNLLVNRMQRIQLKLRETPEGRAGITSLVGDENLTVRSWSAVNALPWAEDIARAELEREVLAYVGLSGLEAVTSLREFDAGRLNTAWDP